jgi:hypothetical protein
VNDEELNCLSMIVRISIPGSGPEGTMRSRYGGVPPLTVTVRLLHCVGLSSKENENASMPEISGNNSTVRHSIAARSFKKASLRVQN